MKELKDFFMKIYALKYHISIFIVFFLIFFVLYFPQDKVLRIVFANISKQTGVIVTPTEPKMTFFPALGLEFKSAELRSTDGKVDFSLGQTSVGVPLTSIITFSPSMEIESKSFRGEITAKILGIPLMPKKQVDEIYLDVTTKGIYLSDFIKTKAVDMNATVDLNIQGDLNLVSPLYSDLDIVSNLTKIQIKEGSVMGFPIPSINIKTGEIALAFAKNELIIAKMNIGAPNDDLNLFVKGKISLKTNNPYDMAVKIKIAGNVEQQFGQFLVMLPAQAKNAQGFYNIRVKGDTRSPIPQITPME